MTVHPRPALVLLANRPQIVDEEGVGEVPGLVETYFESLGWLASFFVSFPRSYIIFTLQARAVLINQWRDPFTGLAQDMHLQFLTIAKLDSRSNSKVIIWLGESPDREENCIKGYRL